MQTGSEEVFGALSIAISVIGYSIYIASILKGKTRPHIFTWVIWGIGVAIVFAAQLSKHEGPGSWAAGFTFVACVAVALLALRHGEKEITRGDKICFISALLALPLWWLTDDPLYSVILIVVIDSFAFYPTVRKTFFKPFEENATVYIFDDFKNGLALLAMRHAATVSVIYPVFALTTNSAFLVTILLRRRAAKSVVDIKP